MPKIAKKPKLADSVIEEIKRMLRDGELKEGDKLPNQNDFAEQLGVSRLSLREALNSLEMIGVIKQKPRVGTVIISGNPDLWMNHMDPPLLSDMKNALELIEARRIIETSMARLAVSRISEHDLKALQSQLDTMTAAAGNKDSAAYLAADIDFHAQLARACDNRYLMYMFYYVFKMMDEFIKEFFEVLPGSVKDSLKMHRLILQSLQEKDEQKYLQSLKLHLETIESSLKNYYASK